MTHYIGLDAHSKTCTGVILDGRGRLVSSCKFDTSERNLLEFVKSATSPKKLAFEEQNLAHWLFILLKDQVEELTIAHPAHLRMHRGAKNDLIDATRLAEELRAGTLTPVFHEESDFFQLRQIVYSYIDFTQDLVRSKNRFKAFLRARNIPTNGQTTYTRKDALDQVNDGDEKFTAVNLLENVCSLQEIKDSYDSKFKELTKKLPVIKNLTTIPGISHVRAATITAIICSSARFSNKHKLWSYCGLVRHLNQSDGRIYGSRKAHGRSELKAVFMGAATTVLCGESGLRRYYDQLRSKGTSHNDGKKAVARRIAAIALMTMKTNKTYDDKHQEKMKRLKTSKA